jgi:uncharacterized low-complexity protein
MEKKMNKGKKTILKTGAVSSVFLALGAISSASAAPTGFSPLGTGSDIRTSFNNQSAPMMLAEHHEEAGEHKAGEHKCGEGKCGEGKHEDKAAEAKCSKK